MKSLIIDLKTKPEDALRLPKGSVLVPLTIEGAKSKPLMATSFSPENVVEVVGLIQSSGGEQQTFYSQAGIIVFAGNNLGWGMGGGYTLGS
jgi:hypothetical protein